MEVPCEISRLPSKLLVGTETKPLPVVVGKGLSCPVPVLGTWPVSCVPGDEVPIRREEVLLADCEGKSRVAVDELISLGEDGVETLGTVKTVESSPGSVITVVLPGGRLKVDNPMPLNEITVVIKPSVTGGAIVSWVEIDDEVFKFVS